MEKHPDDPQAYNMRGSVFAENGRNEQALADFNKAISLDPNYAQAYANRALLYRQNNKAGSRACRLQQGAVDSMRITRRPISAAASSTASRADAPRRWRISTRRSRSSRTTRRPITIAACSIRASISTSSPSTISPPRSGLPARRPRRISPGRSATWRSATTSRRPAISTRRCRWTPTNLQAWTSRGLAYERLGQKDKAAGSYAKALNINDKYEPAKAGFARVGGEIGQTYQTF